MLKFVTLVLALTACNGQVVLNSGLSGLSGLSSLGSYGTLGNHGSYGTLGNHGTIGIGGTQYILVPVGSTAAATTLQLPYLTRQPYTISAPTTTLVQPPAHIDVVTAPAPKPVVIQAPKPIVLTAPQPKIVTEEAYGPPQPYQFGYQSTDEFGNTLSRSETADGSGTVTGSYSYTDAQGLNRIVEYVADAAGYRANVKTNEPGTANANPADVQIQASEPPANVQQLVAAYSTPRAQGINPKARTQ